MGHPPPDGHKLWPEWLRRIDTVLEDETVTEVVAQALWIIGSSGGGAVCA